MPVGIIAAEKWLLEGYRGAVRLREGVWCVVLPSLRHGEAT